VELPIEGVCQGAFTWAWVKAAVTAKEDMSPHKISSALTAAVAELHRAPLGLWQHPYVQLSAAARSPNGLEAASSVRPPLRQISMPLLASAKRRKALIIGINYTGSHAQLKGCVNDAWNLHCLLRKVLQFGEGQVCILTDEKGAAKTFSSNGGAPIRPTRENIVFGINWLLADAQVGDCLVLAFCGFGAQHPESPGSDAHESHLVPCDFAADLPDEFRQSLQDARNPPVAPEGLSSGYRLLPLDEVYRMMARLPAGVAVTMVLDCAYAIVPRISPADVVNTFPKVMRGRVDYAKLQDFVSRPRFLELPPLPISPTRVPSQGTDAFPKCAIRCFSACRLAEWNVELPLEGTVQGSFTWAFVKALAAGNFQSTVGKLHQQVVEIVEDLRRQFSGIEQTPIVVLSPTATSDDPVFGAAMVSPMPA